MPETVEPRPVEAQGGAGLYDVDPEQGDLSQDPEVPVAGDTEALPDEVDY